MDTNQLPGDRYITDVVIAQRSNVFIVNFLFLIGKNLEVLKNSLKLFIGKLISQGIYTFSKRMPTAMLNHPQIGS